MPFSPDELLAGPRGRRLLLAYALASSQRESTVAAHASDDLTEAVDLAASQLDSIRDREAVDATADTLVSKLERPTQQRVARVLSQTPLAPVSEPLLREALMAASDSARYWQPPEAEDLLADTPPVRTALRRVAEHLATSGLLDAWRQPVNRAAQLVTAWGEEEFLSPQQGDLAQLRAWIEQVVETERHRAATYPSDPAECPSGVWWSAPPSEVLGSSPSTFDGSAAQLWYTEDAAGWDSAATVHLAAPEDTDVYEISDAQAWAWLCREFPLDMSASRRHDWWCTTGRLGTWVLPNWAAVAERYDGIHLQTGAYVAAAGCVIPVTEDSASMIAGWAPDTTYWFTSRVRCLDGTVQQWLLEERDGRELWLPQP